MALSAFADKDHHPEASELKAMLGRSAAHWDALVAELERGYDPLTQEWRFSGAKYGWSLQLKHKKRAIVYLAPCERHFLASTALGEKAVAAAKAAGLSGEALEVVEAAPRYAEGRGVRIPVRSKKDLEAVRTVLAAKMST